MRSLMFLLLTVILVCCKKKMEHAELRDFLKNVSSKQLLNARRIFVIPNAGCSGCILNSEQFLFSNIDSLDSSYFILTSLQSLKGLKAKYSSIRAGILNHEKIVIDTAYKFSSVPIDQKYP